METVSESDCSVLGERFDRCLPNAPVELSAREAAGFHGHVIAFSTARIQSLTAAPARLLEHPRIGEKLEEFEPREVRCNLMGHYEMRYEIRESTIYVLRQWHTCADR